MNEITMYGQEEWFYERCCGVNLRTELEQFMV